jgi:hypothetical protein
MSGVPEGAILSEDGYYWWDGTTWQPVDGGQTGSADGQTTSYTWGEAELNPYTMQPWNPGVEEWADWAETFGQEAVTYCGPLLDASITAAAVLKAARWLESAIGVLISIVSLPAGAAVIAGLNRVNDVAEEAIEGLVKDLLECELSAMALTTAAFTARSDNQIPANATEAITKLGTDLADIGQNIIRHVLPD